MEREQTRRRKVERYKRGRIFITKIEYSDKCYRSIKITNASISYLVKKTSDPIAGANKACSNRRSRENKYSYGEPKSTDRVYT